MLDSGSDRYHSQFNEYLVSLLATAFNYRINKCSEVLASQFFNLECETGAQSEL